MKLTVGNMLWTNVDKKEKKYSYLSNNIECDVAIIGGGITGASAAYYLTNENINTVLVDKNLIGYGSTKASTSIIQYEIDTDLTGLTNIIGQDKAVQCFKLCEKIVYDIKDIINTLDDKCDFSLKDCFYYATNIFKAKSLQKEYELRKQFGFDVQYMNKKQCKKRFSIPTEGGIYSTSGAAQIDPYRFTKALIHSSEQKGLKVFENTKIIKIHPYDDYVLLQTNNNFKIKAKKVIIAAGYESTQFIKEKIVDMYQTFTIVSKPVKIFDGWYNKCIMRDNNDPYIYLRTTGNNRIIMGGEDIKINPKSTKLAKLTNENKLSRKKYTTLENTLRTFFPHIDDIEIEFKFSGLFGITKDGLPYIGKYKKIPNCYFSLGYGSNGIIYAILGAQLIKDSILQNERPELKLFEFNR